jgi:hypothetical protein
VLRAHARVLGGQFRFECDSRALLRIVQAAYAHLPIQRLGVRAPDFVVQLRLLCDRGTRLVAAEEPPPMVALAGGGMVCGAAGDSALVAIAPQHRSALLAVTPDMLRFPYHVRYELLEFAVYILAARVQRLVPLHAACVARGGVGILLIGPSGSGKSTVMLHCLLAGLEFVAEDSVMVKPQRLLATGLANFLHIRRDSLRFLSDAAQAARIGRCPLIRRRSGVRKLEIDLRGTGYRLAREAPTISALVFVSSRRAGKAGLLVPLPRAECARRLEASQPYATGQPGWRAFARRAQSLRAYELRRTAHPRDAAVALQQLLAGRG